MTGYELIIAAAASVAAAAVSAYGTYEAGQAQEKASNYNKQVQENNAALATQQANIEAGNLEEKQRRFRAAQRVAFAASGTEEEGSPLLVMADTARQQAKDVYLTKYGGSARAASFEAEAGLQRLYGRQYAQAGAYGAGTGLLSSGANIAANSLYARYGYNYRNGTAGRSLLTGGSDFS